MTSALKDMHAIAYCRVSTEPEDKGQSVKNQIKAIKDWANLYGVKIDNIFSDEGISGGTFPRPNLAMALMSLATSPASMLVCYDQSRLTRDAKAHLPLIEKMIEGKVIRYVIDGDLDTNSLGARMTSAINGVIDEDYRRKLHDKTSLAMKRKQLEGKHIGRPSKVVITANPRELPKGKIKTEEGKSTIILTPEQALNFARQGWTPYKVSKEMLGISPASFIRILTDAHIYEQYKQILEEVRA